MIVIRKGKRRDMRAIWLHGTGKAAEVRMIDQRLLPHRLAILCCRTTAQVCRAIKDMAVRGAPAIGVAGAFGVAQAAMRGEEPEAAAAALRATRPTANDLFFGIDAVLKGIASGKKPAEVARVYCDSIVDECRRIGEVGAALIKDGARILTHCNAGALATVDYGTALAPIRVAHRAGKRLFVYADETRPRLQGARLTAWELLNEGIPHAVIADNAAGHYMQRREIDMVIVGADRITRSGDFANKIGTYEKAVVAKENSIPFYVAAPRSTFDLSMENGKAIPIEERGEEEVLFIGKERLAPRGVRARNPAFDVTPAGYVRGFITADGILSPTEVVGHGWKDGGS